MAIDEDKPCCVEAAEGEVGDRFRGKSVARRLENGFERQLDDWRDAGEAPVLILNRREAQLRKASHARFAQGKNPSGFVAVFFEPLEFSLMWLGFFHSGFFFSFEHSTTVVWIGMFVKLSPVVFHDRGACASSGEIRRPKLEGRKYNHLLQKA